MGISTFTIISIFLLFGRTLAFWPLPYWFEQDLIQPGRSSQATTDDSESYWYYGEDYETSTGAGTGGNTGGAGTGGNTGGAGTGGNTGGAGTGGNTGGAGTGGNTGAGTGSSTGSASTGCGNPVTQPTLSFLKKIVHGNEAKPHSWPWQVGLLNDSEHYCGGSIIDKKFILTAAHCFNADGKTDGITVVAGMHKISAGEGVTINIRRVYIHPHYNRKMDYNDIAVIELATPLQYNHAISPICLPQPNDTPAPGTKCYVTGWGDTVDEPEEKNMVGGSDVLRQVATTIVSDTKCVNEHNQGDIVPSTMICGTAHTGDSCQGDSGGPLQCRSAKGYWYQAGVVSWGIECGGSEPGVYTEITAFSQWIKVFTG